MGKITEFWGKLMEFVKGTGVTGGGREKRPVWKRLNILMMAAAAGALLIILSNAFSTGGSLTGPTAEQDPLRQPAENPAVSGQPEIAELEGLLAQKLEEVLTQIDGVGEVSATVNLASTTEKDYAVNTSTTQKNTVERDKSGGNRTISEVNENGQIVLVRESQGSKEMPVVVKELRPEVRGVLVVAAGAGDPVTKADLMKAVQVYLDVPLYKVMVLPLESR